ncbi:transposase [Photobacterium frigidiphilum]
MKHWQHDDRVYDGTGSSVKYPASTIEACHYIRLVYKHPLRQAQGFIENLLMKFGMDNLQCPDYTLLSKRLKQLNLTVPRFRKHEKPDDKIAVIAIDSTGSSDSGRTNDTRKNIRLMQNAAGERRILLLMKLTSFKAQSSPIKIR